MAPPINQFELGISGGPLSNQNPTWEIDQRGNARFDGKITFAGGISGGLPITGELTVTDSATSATQPAMQITRLFSGTAAEPIITALFKNTGDAVGGSDYQNEVHLRLQAGTAIEHRRYLNFAGFNGVDDWVTGVNALNVWILFDANSVQHRLTMNTTVGDIADGNTYISSASTGSVRINYHTVDACGTGGFQIWSGGAFADNVERFTFTSAGYLGFGTAATLADPQAPLHIIRPVTQMRIGYDASNYMNVTTGIAGSTTFALTGTNPGFIFSQGTTFAAGVVINNIAGAELTFAGAASSSIYQSASAQNFFINSNTGPIILGANGGGSQQLTVTAAGNVGIGTATFGTSAAGVLALFNGTVPSTSPADTVQLFSADISAGNASLAIRTETAVAADVATPSTNSLSVTINGTIYKILLATP